MTVLCALKGCDEPVQPPTFHRSDKKKYWGQGISAGGLGLCTYHSDRLGAVTIPEE